MVTQRLMALSAIEKALANSPLTALKALVYIAEGRVTVLQAAQSGIRLEVRGSKREPYIVRYGRWGGQLITECSCANSEAHPVRPQCSHIAAAKLLWRE